MTHDSWAQNEGTLALILTFPWPWPCPTRIEIARRGSVRLFAEANGSLTLHIEGSTGQVEFQSCPLNFPDGQTTAFVAASWRLPDTANMLVGQTLVLATDKEYGVFLSATARIQTGRLNDLRDFSKENAAALKKRGDTLAGSKADKKIKQGRREATPDEIFKELYLAHQQITDLLTSIQAGKTYHVAGLLRLLRFTITDKNDKPLPLLQMCAAIIDAPLIVYVPPISALKEPILMADVESIAFAINASPTPIAKNPADIDLWLDSRASQLDRRVFNQREMINKITNSVAAHFDLQILPEADMLRAWKSGMGGADIDFLSLFTIAVATAVRDIIPPVLASRLHN